MRSVLFALALMLALAPATVRAQTASDTTAAPQSAVEQGQSMLEGMAKGVTGGRIVAISLGAIAGIIVVDGLTGGLATPAVAGGMIWNGGLWESLVTALSAVGGGYVGNWLYERY